MRAKKLVLVANNLKSRGLKALANKLTEKVGYRVYRVNSGRIHNRTAIVFHQGINKIAQLTAFKSSSVSCPEFSLYPARDELSSKRIVARALISASEGRGITIFNREEQWPRAPLYTEYIPKKKEFRVHVWNNEVVDVSEKRKKKGYENNRDTQIRNTANGYVFCRTGVVEPNGLRTLALGAVAALSRSHGAVDIIWNEKRDKCYVLEVNSRPGMVGTTVEIYANAILRSLK